MLLDSKAEVNAKDNNGATPLHEAYSGMMSPMGDYPDTDYRDVVHSLCQYGGVR